LAAYGGQKKKGGKSENPIKKNEYVKKQVASPPGLGSCTKCGSGGGNEGHQMKKGVQGSREKGEKTQEIGRRQNPQTPLQRKVSWGHPKEFGRNKDKQKKKKKR